MEEIVIPNLQKGLILNNKLVEIANESVGDNQFLDDIKMDKDKDRDKFEYGFYRCSIDLNSDNERIQHKINELSISFNDLFKVNYVEGNDDTNIGNLFAIYNLLVNQNRYGANKLTSILGMSVTNNEKNSILNEYLKSVGNCDFKQLLSSNFEVIGNDVEKSLAPITTQRKLNRVSGNYARVYDTDNKVYILKQKDNNG